VEGHVSLSVVGCMHLGVAGSHGWTGLSVQCVTLLIVTLFVSTSDGSSEVSFIYIWSIYLGMSIKIGCISVTTARW
jgi:hypothetical protein